MHISEVTPEDIRRVGLIIDQGGIEYRVVRWEPSVLAAGCGAAYLLWTGSPESDLFRSVVNRAGGVGQIRWERPVREWERAEFV